MTAYLLSPLELNLELPSLITIGFYSLYYRQKVVFLQLKMVRNQEILCGKALVRLQLKDTVKNIIELGALPKNIAVKTMPINPRLTQAIEELETAIKNNRTERELVAELASELNSLPDEQWGDKKRVLELAHDLVSAHYGLLRYRGAQSSQVGRGIFDQYKACIERDLATVEGINFLS